MPTEELAVWTRELAQSGDVLSGYREAYFNRLTPIYEIMAQLAPSLTGLELRYRQRLGQAVGVSAGAGK